MKILFLLKKNHNYSSYNYHTKASGLLNSATFAAEALNVIGYDTNLEICVDGNEIDKFLHQYHPDVCIIEALWVTPAKIEELVRLHKRVKFIVRIHSNVPFLSNEGIAICWIKKYEKIKNTKVAFNNAGTVNDFMLTGISGIYLPNIYFERRYPIKQNFCDLIKYRVSNLLDKNLYHFHYQYINIGCFCAIRPIKNMLIQAMAAIAYANLTDRTLLFHINATRVEQKGDSTLKNIRALFEMSGHHLIEHEWMEHDEFLEIVETMDLGMQLSMTESFNIVTADFVSQKVPIIVSKEITWMPAITKVEDSTSVASIIKSISDALKHHRLYTKLSLQKLQEFNLDALETWNDYLHNI